MSSSYAKAAFGYQDKTSSYSTTAKNNTTATNLQNAFNNWANLTIAQANQANQLSAAAAYYATAASMADAQKNREFQQSIYNQTAAYNSAEAEANRKWQTEMSNTSYQRAVTDMKAAGINPILAYSNGGAVTPSGSTASVGTLSGSTGNAYTYQAQQANMNNSLVTMGTIATTAIEVMGSVAEKIADIKSGNSRWSWKDILTWVTSGKTPFGNNKGFGSTKE